jgi:hypothetical protein
MDLVYKFTLKQACALYSNERIQRTALGPRHKQAQRKKEKKRKENNAENGGSMKMKMSRNRCALRRIHTTLLAARSAAYQATPTRRKMTTTTLLCGLILGFPLVRYREWGRGTPDTLQEGRATPASVTTQMSKAAGISPDLQNTTPRMIRSSTILATH